MIEETIVSLLVGEGLTVYPMRAPSNADYPCIVYTLISDVSIRSHIGNEMATRRYQLSGWAKTYEEAVGVVEMARSVLDLNTTDFKTSWKESGIDLLDEESGLYHRAMDVFILD